MPHDNRLPREERETITSDLLEEGPKVGGETEMLPSAWTIDSLREHLARVLAERDHRYEVEDSERDRRYVQMVEASVQLHNAQLEAYHNHCISALEALKFEFYEHLKEAREATKSALTASEKAIDKQEAASEKRFESVNEFRKTLADQAERFMSRSEAIAQLDRNAERISDLNDRMNRNEGKGRGLDAAWIYALGAIAALGTVISLFVAFNQK